MLQRRHFVTCKMFDEEVFENKKEVFEIEHYELPLSHLSLSEKRSFKSRLNQLTKVFVLNLHS